MGCCECISFNVVLWNFHGQVLKLKWDISVGSCNIGDELFVRGK